MNSFLFYLILVPVIVIVLLVLNLFFATSKPNEEKLTTFECGFSPVEQARQKFSVHFYLVGILFLVFDIEVLLIFPGAVSMGPLANIGFWIFIFFLVVLTVGFVYEYASGALNYTNKERESEHPPLRAARLTRPLNKVQSRNLSTSSINLAKHGKKLSNLERDSFSVSPNLHDILIGGILGDLFMDKRTNNTRVKFYQSLVHKEYLYHLFNLFSSYTNIETPKHRDYFDKRTNKVYSSVFFETLSLPCFNYYHDLFYVDKVKIIPLNIGELLTPVGLAFWSMDDGSKQGSGFILSTNSFTLSEVQLLVKVLKENFDLNCSIHKGRKDRYKIYILSDSMSKFRSLVTPHFHESMMYKLES